MPRGVYDRSKTKAQRAAEHKATASAAPTTSTAKKATGAKRGPKPGWKAKAVARQTQNQTASSTSRATQSNSGDSFQAFNEIRSNLATLNSLAERFSDLSLIKEEVQANVGILAMLREKHFPKDEEKTASQETVTSSNGLNQSTEYRATVPMPPAPVPTIPH